MLNKKYLLPIQHGKIAIGFPEKALLISRTTYCSPLLDNNKNKSKCIAVVNTVAKLERNNDWVDPSILTSLYSEKEKTK